MDIFDTAHLMTNKYPESMLGVMFSGRHDIEAMKCSDGIDRDEATYRCTWRCHMNSTGVVLTKQLVGLIIVSQCPTLKKNLVKL